MQYSLNVGFLVGPTGATPFDAIGLHTEHWRDRAADSLRIMKCNEGRSKGHAPEPVDDGAVETTLQKRGHVIGFPEMDQCDADRIDRAAARRRLGLDPSRPVVVYCPYPFLSNPCTFWTDNIYGPFRSRPRTAKVLAEIEKVVARADGMLHARGRMSYGADRLVHGVERLRQAVRSRRPPGRRYARDVAQRWDDRGVVKAVRGFCDANGATLVVKPRAKDPVPAYLRAAAARVVDDENYFPATILELMSAADLCVHSFSTVAYEAAYARVPSICVTADADDLGFWPDWRWFLSAAPLTSFNFPGVTYPVTVGSMVDDFPQRRLADFRLDPAARMHYLKKFVGDDDGKASDRLLDLVESGR